MSLIRGMDCAHLIMELCETSLDECAALMHDAESLLELEAVPPGGVDMQFPSSSPRSAKYRLVSDHASGALGAMLRRARQASTHANVSIVDVRVGLLAHFAEQLFLALSHVHEVGFVHCDVNPSHVLLTRSGKLKLTGFGSALRLGDVDVSAKSLQHRRTGSEGWRCADYVDFLQGGAESSSASEKWDMFSAGLVVYFAGSGGKHGFTGMRVERDKMKAVESLVLAEKKRSPPMDDLKEFCAAAHEVVVRCVSPRATLRPSARAAAAHPFFWSQDDCYEFLCIIGNQEEVKINAPGATSALPKVPNGRWRVIEELWMYCKNIEQGAQYDTRLTTHLLRFIRNTSDLCGHGGEMLPSLRRELDGKYGGIVAYILRHFDWLIIGCYRAARSLGWHKRRCLKRFFPSTMLKTCSSDSTS